MNVGVGAGNGAPQGVKPQDAAGAKLTLRRSGRAMKGVLSFGGREVSVDLTIDESTRAICG